MAVYNRIYSKNKWEQVNKYNKELMEDFLLELKAQKKSQGTISQYKNDLRIMFIYILEELGNKEIYKFTRMIYMIPANRFRKSSFLRCELHR